MRNILILFGILSLGIDAFDSWEYAKLYQYYEGCATAKSNALKFAKTNMMMYDPTWNSYNMTEVSNMTTPDPFTNSTPIQNFTLYDYQLM